MTKKDLTLFTVGVLAWSITALGPDLLSAHVRQSSAVSTPRQQAASTNLGVIWEYKFVDGTTSYMGFVDTQINRLAEQGYVVDGFQAVSLLSGSGQGSGPTEILVLLKRARK